MALQYCDICGKQIDLDEDVEHFEEHKIDQYIEGFKKGYIKRAIEDFNGNSL